MSPDARRSASWKVDRLSLKIAASVVPGVLLAGIASVALFDSRIWPTALVVGLAAGLISYFSTRYYLSARIRLAHNTLLAIRRRRFETLDAARVPAGDELSRLIRQVYRTGRALQAEIEELRKLENYRREFLGNVSHELKTPIFAIQGFAETLIDGAMEDPRVNRQFLDRILRNAERLAGLTSELAEISRIETGELVMAPVEFELAPLVREVVESLEVQAESAGIGLTEALPASLPVVSADRERIRQVLVNLIENGIKYNNPGGRVEVRGLQLPSGLVKVTVVDDGIGIDREHIPRLTERFFRVDKSRSRSRGGTGLGLAIVKHILEAHHQRLTVESLPGRGSSFSFTLESGKPVHPPAAAGSTSVNRG